MNQPRSMSCLVFISALMIGCATPPKSEFATFAQVGTGYAVAVDKLLSAAGTAQVDSTSWTLVVERRVTGMDDKTYSDKNHSDLSRLEQISRLRQHAQLLGQYFGLLEALASSDAPERTKASIDGIVSELNNLRQGMPPLVSALPQIGSVAVDFKIRVALREELDKRKDVIREHLTIQEQMLQELNKQIKHALSLNKEAQEQILVIEPLLSKTSLKDSEDWVSTRRRVIYTSLTIDELGKASRAATKLREAFEGLISGEATIGRLNALITDIENLLSVAETIKS